MPFDALSRSTFRPTTARDRSCTRTTRPRPTGSSGGRYHLAITPYPFGNPKFENPSFFEGARRDHWALGAGAPNPVVLPDGGICRIPTWSTSRRKASCGSIIAR